MSETLSVRVDREECIMCGVCWGTCEQVFEEADDGLTQIAEAYRTGQELGQGEVPASMKHCVTEAAEACPVAIIHVDS